MKSLCNRGIILTNGTVSFDGKIGDAVEKYLKTDEITEELPLISSIKYISKEIKIDEITVNNIHSNTIVLNHPNNTLNIKIKGQSLNKLRIGIECMIYDKDETLLCKFAPQLDQKQTDIVEIGSFELEELVTLPTNMTNGEYFIQIYPYVVTPYYKFTLGFYLKN